LAGEGEQLVGEGELLAGEGELLTEKDDVVAAYDSIAHYMYAIHSLLKGGVIGILFHAFCMFALG
jgi:hypothetical protein